MQGGLFYGSRENLPGYRWYDRTEGREARHRHLLEPAAAVDQELLPGRRETAQGLQTKTGHPTIDGIDRKALTRQTDGRRQADRQRQEELGLQVLSNVAELELELKAMIWAGRMPLKKALILVLVKTLIATE